MGMDQTHSYFDYLEEIIESIQANDRVEAINHHVEEQSVNIFYDIKYEKIAMA